MVKYKNIEAATQPILAAAIIDSFLDNEGNLTADIEIIRIEIIDAILWQAEAIRVSWRSSYEGLGDYLAILTAINSQVENIQVENIDLANGAVTIEELQAIFGAIVWPDLPSEAQIIDDVGTSLTTKEEARQFLQDNPNARLLLSLPPADLETAIETRNAAGETLLLKTLAFAVRYLNELIK